MYRALPGGGTESKLVRTGDFVEVINRAEFGSDRSRGFSITDVENRMFP
jgi:hypothetical protein